MGEIDDLIHRTLTDTGSSFELSNFMLSELPCRVNAQIDQSYDWGEPLGPLYDVQGIQRG